MKRASLLFVIIASAFAAAAGERFDEYIRTSPWRSAADELKLFIVPPGFELQLVAAEPEIGKPISMSFDAAGRLWVGETRAYPIETSPDKTLRDRILVLSDFADDGHARKIATFADGLNMPDAAAPYKGGVIAFSIPNIHYLQDTNGNGVADKKDVLFGPFNARDMHNLVNNFRRGFDGWFYGGQGVANNSTVRGRDGHELQMRGATFRFRPDGSHIEMFGNGQANPFGFCFDPLGNFYSSDCETLPIYQLLQGGFYPCFGKPHDGLGYAPVMLRHKHGSSAISGLCYYDDNLWPEEFRGNMFLGNVMTCRVNRDRLTETGSTTVAHEMPDLVISNDPWFRPVDVQLGPDGALYIADFYNRIIAHVEVPLDHPGRDRTSGRIWRLVYKGKDGKLPLRSVRDLNKAPLPEVVEALSDANFTTRLTALNFLADNGGPDVIAAARAALQNKNASSSTACAALWVLERLHDLKDEELLAASRHADRAIRTHAVRIMYDRPELTAAQRERTIELLEDKNALVQRVAAETLARHPAAADVAPLLALRQKAHSEDTCLVYSCRKALRDHFLNADSFEKFDAAKLSKADLDALADVCPAIPSPAAAMFLLNYVSQSAVNGETLATYLQHAARYLPAARMDELIQCARVKATDVDAQFAACSAIQKGMEQRGEPVPQAFRQWAAALATELLESAEKPQRQKAACDLALKFGLKELETPLAKIASTKTIDHQSRTSAVLALLALNPTGHSEISTALLNDASVPVEQRDEIAKALAKQNTAESRKTLIEALRSAASRAQLKFALALSSSPEGADDLLQSIADGKTSAQLLSNFMVKNRISAVRPNDTRLAQLTAKLKPISEDLQKIIDERIAGFKQAKASAADGAAVFQKTCAVCHTIAGQGGNIGPGLDGVGQRGLERICEDVLDPNRNVDRVFRVSIAKLNDGGVISGLFRREDGDLLVFADGSGKEVTVPKGSVKERRETEMSPMPEGFAEAIPLADFYNLLAFLLSNSEKPNKSVK